jgi:uncharacterized protein YjbI with pentapeptide repeats
MIETDKEGVPWSASDSDPPEYRCGFELLPGDVGSDEEYDSLDEWRNDARAASCCRKAEMEGRCRWHADVEPEVLQEAVAEREKSETNLDGAVLRGVKLRDGVSFAGCRLRGATVVNVSAVNPDFTDTNLLSTEFRETDLWRAKFCEAYLRYVNFHEAGLVEAEFRDADLIYAEFTKVNLLHTEFPQADLRVAEFSEASLRYTEFPEADLRSAEFSEADLFDAELPEADLRKSNLSNNDLRGTKLSDADLREANISNIEINRATTVDTLFEPSVPSLWEEILRLSPATDRADTKMESESSDIESTLGPSEWDRLARTYHDLKREFDENGFVGRARRFQIKERRARRYETAEEGGWFSRPHLSKFVSGLFTGYGVGVRRLTLTMLFLFAFSTAVYAAAGVPSNATASNPLMYSVITFTTAPPGGVSGFPWWAKVVAGVETFAGTLLIVSLGFVLGNREQF